MAQTHLPLLLGMKLLTQPSLAPCRPNGSIWMSDGIPLDVASLLHLLTGWEVFSHCSCVPIQQSFFSKEQA